jgi:hypothetical protein
MKSRTAGDLTRLFIDYDGARREQLRAGLKDASSSNLQWQLEMREGVLQEQLRRPAWEAIAQALGVSAYGADDAALNEALAAQQQQAWARWDGVQWDVEIANGPAVSPGMDYALAVRERL